MERTTIDLWFGAFVIAGFVALAVLAFKVGTLGAERPTKITPRILLIVDEFQQFFDEDDRLAQEAALLLDRRHRVILAKQAGFRRA